MDRLRKKHKLRTNSLKSISQAGAGAVHRELA
jgi:hypothetical protein